MKKLLSLIVFSAAIQCFSQSYETKFTDQSIVTISGESFLTVYDFKKIESNSSSLFHIRTGSLLISVRGIIDNASSPQIMISLSAKESLGNEMVITASGDSQLVQYKIEGAGLGSYSGSLNGSDNYIINAGFKIIAPGHPAYILVLPLNIHVSKFENNKPIRCFIDGTAYAYNAEKRGKTRKKKNVQ